MVLLVALLAAAADPRANDGLMKTGIGYNL
jgi:hypothetical protein